MLAAFSIGIGTGALLCDRLSGGRIELGLVGLGALGITLFIVRLYTGSPSTTADTALLGPVAFLTTDYGSRIFFDTLLLGLFGGIYIVPLTTLIQKRSSPKHRARVIAGNNVLSALAMVLASGFAILALNIANLSIPQLFLLLGAMNAMVAVYIAWRLPEFLLRFLAWLLTPALYRLRKQGVANLPEEGPALLVCNHVSFVDAIILSATAPRPIRFVMYHKIFRIPLLSFIFRGMKAIPIAPAKEDPRLLDNAYDRIDAALAAGEWVCIFPEGG
ncbi:1-acyl-sn-glycerol-3-phosphate acyltransferase [Alkalilimnicola ehrlichii]|uniref:1-acyl-sn-glycerol-3-phosphate acyltransferase n=1 Tax=Alkalilimnicola ehrlichii TaxID=351052 RepID=UPI001C6E4AEF|nr:1-acyl-sn-glycerol-3-phosphate acyltransferase [Alkalilimnicola ehrlichii]